MSGAAKSQVRLLAEGLYFAEAPRWHMGTLWFSDFYDHAVKTVDLDGKVETKLEVVGQPSGLGWLPDGRMLVVSMLDRSVLRFEAERLVVHADLSSIATYHCNDMVVDAAGRAYVGNFGFDLDAAIAERGVADVLADHVAAELALVQADGSVSVAATDLHFPNGAVITPDGTRLILAETLAGCLTAFDIAADGTLSNRRVWAQLAPGRAPDGICLDAEGAIWFADATSNACVRVARGGKELQVVTTDQECFACMLGGPSGRDLFMLTSGESDHVAAAERRTAHILVTEVAVPHAGRP